MVKRSAAMHNATAIHYPRRHGSRNRRGQAMTEFAVIAPVAIIVMMIGVQFAMIGQAALAVSQGASALARYAANNNGLAGTTNGTVTYSSLPASVQQLLSPLITTNSGADLTITVNSYSGSGTKEGGTIAAQSDEVVINLSYDTASKLAVPNPFMAIPGLFPGITFPNPVTASDSQMYE